MDPLKGTPYGRGASDYSGINFGWTHCFISFKQVLMRTLSFGFREDSENPLLLRTAGRASVLPYLSYQLCSLSPSQFTLSSYIHCNYEYRSLDVRVLSRRPSTLHELKCSSHGLPLSILWVGKPMPCYCHHRMLYIGQLSKQACVAGRVTQLGRGSMRTWVCLYSTHIKSGASVHSWNPSNRRRQKPKDSRDSLASQSSQISQGSVRDLISNGMTYEIAQWVRLLAAKSDDL